MEDQKPLNDLEGQNIGPGDKLSPPPNQRFGKQPIPATASAPAGKGNWVTLDSGLRIFIPEGADATEIINRQINEVKAKPSKKTKNPVKSQAKPFGKVREDYQELVKNSDKDAFSFNPKTGKVTDAFDKQDAANFFDNHSVNGEPVYVISKTNNQGGLNRRTRIILQSNYQ